MRIAASAFAAVVFTLTMAAPAVAQDDGYGAQVSTSIAPPPLRIEDQPPLPGTGYLWTPGYWAWNTGADEYVWVAGRWSLPPRVGYLWTPAWWDFDGGYYRFNNGYWGERVGWYGGLALGFGYTGFGYWGGAWRGNDFWYNRSVTNITNVSRISTVYNREVFIDRHADARGFGFGRHDGAYAIARERGFAGRTPFAAGASPMARVQAVEARTQAEAFAAPRVERFGETRPTTERAFTARAARPHVALQPARAPHASAHHEGGGGHRRA